MQYCNSVILAPHGLLSAEKAAPEKTKPDSAIVWHDCKDIGVEGKGWTGTGAPYDRLPAKAEGEVPKQDWQLGHHSAGLCVRFLTDAPSLQVRWELRASTADQVLRIAFAFDPDRNGILLIGGDKSGISKKRFYKQLIEKADELYAAHLAALKAKKKGKK